MRDEIRAIIGHAWEDRARLTPGNVPSALRSAIDEALAALDCGKVRVAEKTSAGWITHQWLKMAVLLSFRIEDNQPGVRAVIELPAGQ